MTRRARHPRLPGLAAGALLALAALGICEAEAARPLEAESEGRRFIGRGEVVHERSPGHAAGIHLLGRAAFGPTPELVAELGHRGIETWIEEQLHPEEIQDPALELRLTAYPVLAMSSAELVATFPPGSENPETRAQRIVEQLQAARITRAVHAKAQLREVLVDFWLNHFSVYAPQGPTRYSIVAFERDAIRPHVLGRFEDMLVATARSPAMLYYLDNYASSAEGSRVNRSGINENYARELLELHTLGVDGGFTQEDVVAVARVFTGWTITRERSHGTVEFLYRSRWHDTGTKQVLGRTLSPGQEEEGLELLHLLATHPSTAEHVATELVRRLVSDTPPPGLVERARDTFLGTEGDLREVTRVILGSPEFRDRRNRGAKIKTPLELVASSLRSTRAEVLDGLPAARLVSQLGQPLYSAPAPTGWPEVAPALVGSGAMLDRFDVLRRIALGRIKGIDGSAWQALWPEGQEPDPGELALRLLSTVVSRQTLHALREAQDQGASTDLLAALLLSSPEFQRQ